MITFITNAGTLQIPKNFNGFNLTNGIYSIEHFGTHYIPGSFTITSQKELKFNVNHMPQFNHDLKNKICDNHLLTVKMPLLKLRSEDYSRGSF